MDCLDYVVDVVDGGCNRYNYCRNSRRFMNMVRGLLSSLSSSIPSSTEKLTIHEGSWKSLYFRRVNGIAMVEDSSLMSFLFLIIN